MDVHWDPPDQMNGLLQQYTVSYSATYDNDNVTETSEETTLTNLLSCTPYIVQVKATNGASGHGGGTSESSSATSGQTEDGRKFLILSNVISEKEQSQPILRSDRTI